MSAAPLTATAAPAGGRAEESADRVRSPAQARLLVCGVVRDGARRMNRDLDALARATAGFGEVHWRIVESDSSDDTPALLAQRREHTPNFDFVCLGRLRDRHPLRTDRIAQARNACLGLLETDARLAGITHVMVADLDGVCAALTPAALAHCFTLDEPWDMVAANQGDFYYDLWALRHPLWCPGDVWVEKRALEPLVGPIQADQLAVLARMLHLAPSLPPIEVDSAFGGLALYRREALQGARYEGLTPEGDEVCEHVALHLAMRRAGRRLYVVPALINAHKTRHGGRHALLRTLRRQVWAWLRGKAWR